MRNDVEYMDTELIYPPRAREHLTVHVVKDPVQAFAAVVAEKQKVDKLSYVQAVRAARAEHPELATAYNAAMINAGRDLA